MKFVLVFLVTEAEEGGYTARAVDHDLFTDAESLDELKVNISEAVDCHFTRNDNSKIEII